MKSEPSLGFLRTLNVFLAKSQVGKACQEWFLCSALPMITGSGRSFTLELMALHAWMFPVPLKAPAANRAQLTCACPDPNQGTET